MHLSKSLIGAAALVLSATGSALASMNLYYALPTFVIGDEVQYVTPTVGGAYPDTESSFSITSGTLPDGLSLDGDTGEITGTPGTSGSYSFTVTVTCGSDSASKSFSGTVAETSTELSRAYLAAGNMARLQNVIEKARNGETIHFAAIGGSITAGTGADTTAQRYVNQVYSWLSSTFSSASITLNNAGIGATASDYGALRAYRDVIEDDPDLVIVEFAVNEAGSTISTYGETYEGLVRQLLNAPGKPAVILLFMTGCTYNGAQDWESLIGAHYELPMVSYEDAVKPELEDSSIDCDDISSDGTHPNTAGHALTASFIEDLIQRAIDAFPEGSTAADIPAMPTPYTSSAFEFASMSDGTDLSPTSSSGWTSASTDGIGAGFTSSTPGSTLEFSVDGDRVIVQWEMSNDGDYGEAEISIDGSVYATVDANFEDGWGDYRGTTRILSGLSAGTHDVKIELLADTTSSGNEFRVLCIGSGDSTLTSAQAWMNADASSTNWFDTWMGYVYRDADSYGNWVYSSVHGWLYVWPDSEADSTLYWDNATTRWMWSEETDYPFIYDYSEGGWLYYTYGSSPSRHFWSYNQGAFLEESGM